MTERCCLTCLIVSWSSLFGSDCGKPQHDQDSHIHMEMMEKPLVEKLRRERINTCIEQLKSLLGPEFLKQQPDSKLEKADILEMTVCFLKELQHQRNLLTHSNKLQTASDEKLKEADFSILSSTVQTSITQCSLETKDNSDLWRPW
uniref:BHLH domain-containing protein n=1 Tax=Oreochromis niloticus TaxID=8128 RepID=A0A669BTU7_ORENI